VRQPIGKALGWIGTAARLVVGTVWIVAGLLKLPDPAASVRAVRAYRLLPESTVTVIGYGLPILEVCLGVLLVIGLGTRAAAALSALLFVAYIVGISSAWARGLQIDCGCFGGGGYAADATSKYPGEIACDIGLLALCAFLVVRPRTVVSLDAWLIPAENG
jgi:uncharacterized membrane protein YphA (DoxX/SURF4 family)